MTAGVVGVGRTGGVRPVARLAWARDEAAGVTGGGEEHGFVEVGV
ncbi:hypothetical protein [Streptomyces flavalbus]|uniref:Uncharacterized protein n=1 Tax=Streptomyces flavalbus TaxID=2665155 RepID=A0ABW2WBG3_9ACTN